MRVKSTGGVKNTYFYHKVLRINNLRDYSSLELYFSSRSCSLMTILFLIFGFLLIATACLSEIVEDEGKERIYGFKKCSGSGCPYAASWLAHVNLYRRIPWWLDSTKMEAASFNM